MWFSTLVFKGSGWWWGGAGVENDEKLPNYDFLGLRYIEMKRENN